MANAPCPLCHGKGHNQWNTTCRCVALDPASAMVRSTFDQLQHDPKLREITVSNLEAVHRFIAHNASRQSRQHLMASIDVAIAAVLAAEWA